MIGLIRGKLVEKQPPFVIVEAFGVGYEIEVPLSTLFDLPQVEGEVLLFTHFIVREDAQLLYGFYHRSERNLFRLLLKVNGIGPKVGLALLSALNTEALVTALLNEDVKLLTQVPGVGKKTAERLVLELRDKIKSESYCMPATLASIVRPTNTILYNNLSSGLKSVGEREAESALVSLGFKLQDAEKSVQKIFDESLSSEELIRRALKEMLV